MTHICMAMTLHRIHFLNRNIVKSPIFIKLMDYKLNRKIENNVNSIQDNCDSVREREYNL